MILLIMGGSAKKSTCSLIPSESKNVHRSARSVVIEPLKTAHACELFNVLKDTALHEHLDYLPPDALGKLEEWIKAVNQGGSVDGKEIWRNWAIIVDGHVEGYVQSTIIPAEHEAEIAFILSKSQWGTGVALEAATKMIEEVSSEWPIKSFRAETEEDNMRSRGLLVKLGFIPDSINGTEVAYKKVAD